jgi:hypothetical protein
MEDSWQGAGLNAVPPCSEMTPRTPTTCTCNRAAQQEFQPIAALAASRGSQLLPVPSDACGDAALLQAAAQPGSCFLFARRFPAATAAVGAAPSRFRGMTETTDTWPLHTPLASAALKRARVHYFGVSMQSQVVLDVWHDPGSNLSILQDPKQYDPRARRHEHPDCSNA